MTRVACERKVLKDVAIGEEISSIELTKKVKELYYIENGETTHVFTETLIKNIRKFRQTGEFYFICVDNHKSIYQRVM